MVVVYGCSVDCCMICVLICGFVRCCYYDVYVFDLCCVYVVCVFKMCMCIDVASAGLHDL